MTRSVLSDLLKEVFEMLESRYITIETFVACYEKINDLDDFLADKLGEE